MRKESTASRESAPLSSAMAMYAIISLHTCSGCGSALGLGPRRVA